jgi:hypothetical protein
MNESIANLNESGLIAAKAVTSLCRENLVVVQRESIIKPRSKYVRQQGRFAIKGSKSQVINTLIYRPSILINKYLIELRQFFLRLWKTQASFNAPRSPGDFPALVLRPNTCSLPSIRYYAANFRLRKTTLPQKSLLL